METGIVMKVESKFIKHIACPHCTSSDGNSLYDDGHAYCHVCHTYTPSGNETSEEREYMEILRYNVSGGRTNTMLPSGQTKAIPDRGISQATCDKFGVTQDEGKHFYPYADADGIRVAVKVRNVADKSFTIAGNFKEASLFGQHLFHSGGKYVTVYEGELDALAGYQLTGSQWPSVSIRNGASAALKDCKAQYEWLNSFEAIVICFDNDEPGKKAAKEVAEVFGQKAKIVQHKAGFKDACDYLKAGASKEFVNEWWKAEVYIPDGIINAASLWEEVIKPEPVAEAQYPWEGLNKLLYGFRPAELITVTAGSGLGKSQFLREILYHLLKTTSWNIGGLFLEESTRKTARSIMSLHANKLLHLPDTPVTEKELKDSFDATLGSNRIYLFDHFGSSDVDNIANRIRYMAKACDCRVVFLDHISIVVSGQDVGDERKAIDNMMTKLRTLVQELEVTLICVSHLRRPQGNSGHEDGGSVSLSQLRGSGAIAQLSDAVITLERNSMAENEEERHTTKVAVAKNRYNGYTGPACGLKYDKMTGRMIEQKEEVL
jgi:twinkle protein